MADVLKERKHYPTIVELKGVEMEIRMLLDFYKSKHSEYLHDLRHVNEPGFREKTNADLMMLNEANSMILALLDKAKTLMAQVYPKGMKNQGIVSLEAPDLLALSDRLQVDEMEIHQMAAELRTVEGENDTVSLQTHSYRLQYVIMAILLVVTIALLVRAFGTGESGTIETIILVAAIGLIVYHFLSKML